MLFIFIINSLKAYFALGLHCLPGTLHNASPNLQRIILETSVTEAALIKIKPDFSPAPSILCAYLLLNSIDGFIVGFKTMHHASDKQSSNIPKTTQDRFLNV